VPACWSTPRSRRAPSRSSKLRRQRFLWGVWGELAVGYVRTF